MKIIEVKDLSFSYTKAQILHNLNFTVEKNDFIIIKGNNGSGKSTLLKLIIGQLKNYEGKIKLFNEDLQEFNSWEKIGYVPQIDTHNTTNFPISVKEMIMLNLYYDFNMFNLPKKKHKEMVNDAITTFNLKELADKNYNELSGGEKQRVMIAKAMVHFPEILIFDEPTVGVDKNNKKKFYELIEHLHSHHNITIILVTHEIEEEKLKKVRRLELKDGDVNELA